MKIKRYVAAAVTAGVLGTVTLATGLISHCGSTYLPSTISAFAVIAKPKVNKAANTNVLFFISFPPFIITLSKINII